MSYDLEKLLKELIDSLETVKTFDKRLKVLEGDKHTVTENKWVPRPPSSSVGPISSRVTSNQSGFDNDGFWRSVIPAHFVKTETASGRKPIQDTVTSIEPCPYRPQPEKKRIALIVGHNAIVKGAYSEIMSKSEYDFNLNIAKQVKNFPPLNSKIEVFSRTTNTSRKFIRDVVMDRHANHPFDAIIEMHFNSFGSSAAQGCEVLISNISSQRNKDLGQAFYRALVETMGTRGRGLKPISKGDRGFSNIDDFRASYGFEGPVLLAEPFFASNPSDCSLAGRNAVGAYYNAIEKLAEKL